jgi:hypothetical protein
LYKQGLLEEFYPSIRINIWCCPTLRVLDISCVHVMVNGLWFMLGIIEVYLQIWFRHLTNEVYDGGRPSQAPHLGQKPGCIYHPVLEPWYVETIGELEDSPMY